MRTTRAFALESATFSRSPQLFFKLLRLTKAACPSRERPGVSLGVQIFPLALTDAAECPHAFGCRVFTRRCSWRSIHRNGARRILGAAVQEEGREEDARGSHTHQSPSTRVKRDPGRREQDRKHGFVSPAELWTGEEERDKQSPSDGAAMSSYTRALRRVLKITLTD